ncbi:hypothetical protein RDABS01_029236 [Bienertia sinuspersici]
MAKATYLSLFLMVLLVASIGVQVSEAQTCGWQSTGDCCYRCGYKCLNVYGGTRTSAGNYWACSSDVCWCYYGPC